MRLLSSTSFEQMLSFRPKILSPLSGREQEAPTVRDMVFDYYCRKYNNNTDRANEATRQYTDILYRRFVDGRS